jgi:NADH-quinone oxidoreductase subunit F
MSEPTRLDSAAALQKYQRQLRLGVDQGKMRLHVCVDTACHALGASEVCRCVEEEVAQREMGDRVEIKRTGCHGLCERGPVVMIMPDEILYQEIDAADAPDMVTETVQNFNLLGRLLFTDHFTGQHYVYADQIPFYRGQMRRVLALNGRIDPTSIDDYLAEGGYSGLARAVLELTPDEVIDEVLDSGLRGRGGAGFPTGRKWRFTRDNPGAQKYVIVNADEGDPGAFMDRAVLEGNPHSVLEGAAIAGYAMGATKGYIYCRAEYPVAVARLELALGQAREMGLIGPNILGSDFEFELKVKLGAGAFVCGEETALMASIMGKRGMPRIRPPFPPQSGLWAMPTCINNVETMANVPIILKDGAENYAAVGTEGSKGTKIFSLTGRVRNTGLVEVPIGTSMREVIFDIGGGVPRGRQFKAAQMGGPSGGCVPARYADIQLDYESLQKVGAIIGSGGMIVMDDNTCMVDLARFFVTFTQEESCGQCAPCRLGTKQMLMILERITQGLGVESDLELLENLATDVKRTSLCGLGQTCPNPVLSTIQHFKDEYLQHILDRRCPAAVCEAMAISPCQHACPAGIDVPAYVALIGEGRFMEATEVIRERNPFPSVCGRICTHPCELKCRRGEVDDSIAIRALKRQAADYWFEHHQGKVRPWPVTKKEKVAIVGSGPAGLTCGYYLRKMGYEADIFEAQDRAGGMLGVAVPEFRLPRYIIDLEIDHILQRGVNLHLNSPIDARRTPEDLLAEGYGAVFLAAGAMSSMRLNIPGEERKPEGLFYGLPFLMDVRKGHIRDLSGQTVIVVGGGNVAIDVARTCVRLGAVRVDVVCLEGRRDMPATELEITAALAEGIELYPAWGPEAILGNGRVEGLSLIACTRVFDDTGRFNPSFDETVKMSLKSDVVIPSIGQAVDLSFLPEDSRLERAVWGRLTVDDNSLRTNVEGIFAGGDFTTGPTFAVRAIGSGRRAALSIDRYLRGVEGRLIIPDEKIPLDVERREPEPGGRIWPGEMEADRRSVSFDEVEQAYTEEQARAEARRCLRCDLERGQ